MGHMMLNTATYGGDVIKHQSDQEIIDEDKLKSPIK
jgi:hypothetical protein